MSVIFGDDYHSSSNRSPFRSSIRAAFVVLSCQIGLTWCPVLAQDSLGVPGVYLGTWVNFSENIWTSITLARGRLRIAGAEENDKICRVEQAKTYQHGGMFGIGGEAAVAITCGITPQFRRRIAALESVLSIQASPNSRRVIHLKQKDGGRLIDVSEEIVGLSPEREMFMGEFGRR